MGNAKDDDRDLVDKSGEAKLRGGALGGAERDSSVEHSAYQKKRGPDSVVRLDNEKDTLFSDGLELEDDAKPLSSTDGRDDSV